MDDFEVEFRCFCEDTGRAIDHYKIKADGYEREERWAAAAITREHVRVLRRLLAGDENIFDDPQTALVTSLQVATGTAWGHN